MDKIVTLRSPYNKAKIFPLTRTVIQESNSVSRPPNPFAAGFYQACDTAEKDKVSCHGNATQNSKSNFWTSKYVLQKARQKCVNGLNAKTVNDEIIKESGGVYSSSSQSSELRNTRQVHRQKAKAKMTKGMSTPEF